MQRRELITSVGALGLTACAGQALAQSKPQTPPPPPPPPPNPPQGSQGSQGFGESRAQRAATYTREELAPAVSDFFGVTVESAGAAIEKIFKDQGQPTGYIAGEEGSAAAAIGARYGRGLLYMKASRDPTTVFWQGPSIGFDAGGNASRVFVLCYNLQYPDAVFRRFPGVEGSAYFIGGLGINYLRGDTITLAPIRAGVGLRLGANVGYLVVSRKRNIFPF